MSERLESQSIRQTAVCELCDPGKKVVIDRVSSKGSSLHTLRYGNDCTKIEIERAQRLAGSLAAALGDAGVESFAKRA